MSERYRAIEPSEQCEQMNVESDQVATINAPSDLILAKFMVLAGYMVGVVIEQGQHL